MRDAVRDTHSDPGKAEAILRAARREFATRGYRAADVQVVADRAGVGKGTVYRYFESKEGLFRAVSEAGMQQLEEQVMALLRQDEPSVALMRRMAVAYAAWFQANPEHVEIMIQERAEFRGAFPDTHQVYRERNLTAFGALLRALVEEGIVRPIDVSRTLTAVGDALYGTVVRGVIDGRGEQLTSDVEFTIDLFLDGIRAVRTDTRQGDDP